MAVSATFKTGQRYADGHDHYPLDNLRIVQTQICGQWDDSVGRRRTAFIRCRNRQTHLGVLLRVKDPDHGVRVGRAAHNGPDICQDQGHCLDTATTRFPQHGDDRCPPRSLAYNSLLGVPAEMYEFFKKQGLVTGLIQIKQLDMWVCEWGTLASTVRFGES